MLSKVTACSKMFPSVTSRLLPQGTDICVPLWMCGALFWALRQSREGVYHRLCFAYMTQFRRNEKSYQATHSCMLKSFTPGLLLWSSAVLKVIERNKYPKGEGQGHNHPSMVQRLRVLPMEGAWVWSLVGELKSHMLCSVAKTIKKKKSHYFLKN